MTATRTAPTAGSAGAGPAVRGNAEPFTGTGQLLRLALRRDRVRLPVWVVAIAGITYATAVAEEGLYSTQEAVDSYAALVGGSPVTVAFAGPPLGLTTLAGIVVYEMSLTVILGISLMAIFTVARHTRAEEESGRSELLRATEVGRHAGAAAALLVTALACLATGAAVAVALLPTVITAETAVVFSAGMALLGIVYAGVTLCLAQLFVHARSVTGAALAVFALGYVLRAAGDVREDWLVWLSPVGWAQAVHVPTENRWWPLLVPMAATALLLVLAVVLAERRDFGGGMLPSLPGRPTAPPTLTGTVGLTWRVQRGALLGWSVALLGLAAITGTLGSSMQDMVRDNPTMADYLELAEGGSVLDSYLATVLLIFALTASGFAVWSAAHGGAQEDEGQVELLLAGPLDRTRFVLAGLLVTAAGTAVVVLAAAAGLGVTHGMVTGDVSEGLRVAASSFAYYPAVLVLVGVVTLLRGWVPRWAGVGWAVLAFVFVIGWLGGLLDPPRWVADLSPFSHVPRVPLESAASPALAVLTALALALVGLGLVGFRRRDVGVG